MARSWEYSTTRRIVMQGTMWVVLAGTVALAAVVSRYKVGAAEVELGQAVAVGDLIVRLPVGWQVTSAGLADGRAPIIVAQDMTGSPRVLAVVLDRLEEPMAPLDYLSQSGLLPMAYRTGGGGQLQPPVQTTVAGRRGGLLIMGVRPLPLPNGRVQIRKDLIATAILPSRQVVSLKLEGVGEPTADDVALVRQVAESVRVRSETASVDQTAPGGRPRIEEG